MADILLFGRLANARQARPRRFRLFNAHLDEYFISERDVKSRFRFGRDSINYLADLLSDDLARNTARNHALSPLVQVLVALRFFASLCVRSMEKDEASLYSIAALILKL